MRVAPATQPSDSAVAKDTEASAEKAPPETTGI